MKSGKKSEKKSKKTSKKKKLSSNITTIILILIFLVGLSVMLYPTVSNYINQRHQSKAIAAYDEKVSELENRSIFMLQQKRSRLTRQSRHPLWELFFLSCF